MNHDVILKKNIIGGFDKKQVIEYITHLQSSCDERRAHEEIEELRLRVAALRELLKEKDKQITALNEEIDKMNEIELPGDEPQSDFDVLRRAAQTIEDAKSEAETITDKVSEGIKSKEERITALFAMLSGISDEITRFSDRLSGLSAKIDDVPFEPVTEADVDTVPTPPTFNFDRVAEAYAEEKAALEAQAAARAKSEAEALARLEAVHKARLEMEERARKEAEEKARHESEERARLEAEAAAIAAAAEAAAEEAAGDAAVISLKEDKFNALFAKLTAMTEELDRMRGSISDVSKKA